MQRILSSARQISLMAVLLLGAAVAGATSTLPQPAVTLAVRDVALSGLGGGPVYLAPAAPGRPPAFGATVTRAEGSLPADVYFGVMAPGGPVFTWVPKPGGGAVPVEGLRPLVRAWGGASLSTAAVLGEDPQYTFTEREPPGLYSVFLLLVPSGADPGNPVNWSTAQMAPLMFHGVAIPATTK